MVNFNSFLEKNRIVVQIFYEQLTVSPIVSIVFSSVLKWYITECGRN